MKKGAGLSNLNIPPALYQSIVGRLLMVMLLAGSVGLLWWSVSRLSPLNQEVQKQTGEIARLSDEVQRLERNWDEDQAEQAAALFNKLQDELFGSPRECAVWQENLTSGTNFSDLVVKASQGTGRPILSPFPEKKVGALPVTLEIQPLADANGPDSPYRRMMMFLDSELPLEKRVDLVEMTVQGRSNSVSHVKLELQLWTREIE
jgi:hypothetical protein